MDWQICFQIFGLFSDYLNFTASNLCCQKGLKKLSTGYHLFFCLKVTLFYTLLYFFAILLLRFAAISFACYILISLILILSLPSLATFLLRCFMILYLVVLFCHFIVEFFLFHLLAPFVPFFDLIFTLISHFSAWLIKCLRPVKILFSAIYRLFLLSQLILLRRG